MSVTYFKTLIKETLGDKKFEQYCNTLSDWFNNKITKDFYDLQMEMILCRNNNTAFSLHNEMIKLILRNVSKGFTEFSVSDSDVSHLEELKAAANSKQLDQQLQKNKRISRRDSGDSSALSSEIDSSPEDSSDSNDSTNGIDVKKEIEMCTLPIKDCPIDQLPRNPRIVQGRNDFSILHLDNENEWARSKFISSGKIENITHSYKFEEYIPNALQMYLKPNGQSRNFTSKRISLQGKFYLKALNMGLKIVTQEAFDMALKESRNRIKKLVIAIVKQRKAFQLVEGENGKTKVHFMSGNYPNPYLKQGWHFYSHQLEEQDPLRNRSNSTSSELSIEEQERLACLQYASAAPPKPNCIYRKADLNDLHAALMGNKLLVPNNTERLKFITNILKRKIAFTNITPLPPISKRIHLDDDDEDDEEHYMFDSSEDESNLVPTCAY